MTGLLILALTFGITSAILDQPYGDDSFNSNVEYGDNVTLECVDDRIENKTYTVSMWVLPDLTIMRANDSIPLPTIDGNSSWAVSDDATHLHVTLISTDEQFGLYHCHVTLAGTHEEVVVKKGINYRGPYFGDLWYKYEHATVVSLSVSAAFTVVCIAATIFYWFVYDREEEEEEKFKIEEIDGYENMGFTAGDSMEKIPVNGIKELPVSPQQVVVVGSNVEEADTKM